MKKLFTMLLCLIVGIGSMFAQVNASGTLSNGGTWKLQQGTLYVEASAIPNFKKSYVDGGAWHAKTTAPWWVYGQYINEIQVDGASTIGSWAFAGLTKVQRVVIAGVTSVEIGEYAFGGCSSLSSVDGFQYMTQIGQGAFMGCPLKYVVLPKVTSLGSFAFGSQDGSNASADVGYAKYTVMLNTSSVPTFDNIDFMLCDRAARLIVPASLKSQISALWDADAHNPQTNRMNREFQMQEICVGGLLNQNNSRNFWMLNDDGTLWVVGTMPDFANASDAPWYSLRSQIKTVIVDIASKIGNNAFRGYPYLTKVIAENISTVGDYAFCDCAQLKDAYIQNVRTIGKNAFENCSALQTINLRNAINTIDDNAFKGSGLKSIYLGLPLQSIGNNAFATTALNNGDIYVNGPCPQTSSSAFGSVSCSTITLHVSIDYADSYKANNVWKQFQVDKIVSFPVVTDTWSINQVGTLTILNTIPDYAKPEDQPWYAYRDYIHSIVVKENVTKIGDNAFAFKEEGESHVEEVEIPATVETIGENAFKNNDQIEEVEAEGVQTIGNQAFENCSSLEKVKFGKDLSSIGNKAFNYCGLVDVMAVKSAIPPAITARTFEGIGRMSANAPAKVKAKYAARRAQAAAGQKSVSLEVPDEHISKYLAAQYWNLFTFEYIGEHGGIVESDQAYDGLYVLYSDGTMIISASAPTDPQNINTGFTISSNAKSKVKRVEIQGLLTKLGHQFNDCPNLEEVVLSGGINSLNGTFNNCPKLKTINLENVQYLKSHQQGNKVIPCFGGCVALQEVNIPDVLEIGDNCFKGCTGLTKVALGGEAEVGMEAFSGCTSLKRIALGNAKLNGALQAFQGCTALEEMTYSGTRMPAEIFKGCTALHKINLGGSLKDILSEAFANTSIDSIYVQCPTPPEAAANAFSGINLSSIKVIVPDAFDGPYWSAPVWEEMFFYDDEDYAELDFPIHFAIGSNGFGTVDESGNLTINAMGALVDNFRDYVEPYAPYITGEIRIGNEVSSLPAGTPYRLPFGWVKENGPRAIVLGSGLLELGDYALYNNVWDCDLIVDCYALNPPVMKGANVFNWSRIQNGSQCVATLDVVNDAAVEAAYRADTYWKKFSISSWLSPADAPAECTVTFVDWDGTILQQTTTRPGMMVTPPADPVREGYTFKGWDSQDYTWVVSDLTITATYYDETFTVRFYDWDGTLLSEQQVHYGQAAEAPADPAREGYTFLGWSEDFSDVTLDKYIVAMYHNDHEGIEDIQPDQVPNIKVMIDGVIYILRDGKIYNILGTEVK